MAILVTGAAGFIGSHLTLALLDQRQKVFGLDNLNDYYDVQLKQDRLANIKAHTNAKNFTFEKIDLADKTQVDSFFKTHGKDITKIVHLAAQAGVRYSLINPHAYIAANINGHLNILEGARGLNNLESLVYASSSSVYGGNKKIPFSVDDPADSPVSLYAATKRSDELMSYCYSHLFKIPVVGLRLFTVYGPWGRPDMAPIIFCDAIHHQKPVSVFNNGNMKRDFTYIDDVVDGIMKSMDFIPDEDDNGARSKIFNIGNNNAEQLMDFIDLIEHEMGIPVIKEMKPMQMGDVVETYADIDESRKLLGYSPKTTIQSGIPQFVKWYKDYYGV